MKRLLAMLLTVVMLLSAASLAGAETYNATGYPICDELITVTAAGQFGLDINYEEILTWKEWQDRLGIKFEMIFYNYEDWKTQLTLMLAADELPDMLHSAELSNSEMADYGTQGYFVNLLDYPELIPNLTQAWEDYPGFKGACTSYDGGMYGTKFITTSTVNKIARTFINNEWLARVNKEMPTTIDELYDVLVAFKEQDANGNGDPNDEIPLGFYTTGGTGRTLTTLLTAYGINSDTGSGHTILQADADNKIYLADTTEAYKAFLAFLNKCYTEGLMDPEAFTLTGNEVMLNCQKDLYGFYGCGSAPFVMSTSSIDTDKAWSGVMGLTSEYNDTPTLGIPSGISGSFRMAINAESEHKEALVRFVDYLFGDEGGLSVFSGYEGVTFDYLHDDLLDADVLTIRCPEGYSSSDEFRQYKAVFNGPFLTYSGIPARNTLWYDASDETLKKDEVIAQWGWMAQLASASRRPDLKQEPTFPEECLSYTEDELNERTTLRTDIDTYLTQSMANFIMGVWSLDSDWDTYLETLKTMRLEDYLAIEQAAWDRYIAE